MISEFPCLNLALINSTLGIVTGDNILIYRHLRPITFHKHNVRKIQKGVKTARLRFGYSYVYPLATIPPDVKWWYGLNSKDRPSGGIGVLVQLSEHIYGYLTTAWSCCSFLSFTVGSGLMPGFVLTTIDTVIVHSTTEASFLLITKKINMIKPYGEFIYPDHFMELRITFFFFFF